MLEVCQILACARACMCVTKLSNTKIKLEIILSLFIVLQQYLHYRFRALILIPPGTVEGVDSTYNHCHCKCIERNDRRKPNDNHVDN